jgi:hypothetical protein
MLDEETKKHLQQMLHAEQEKRFHELCQLLGTVHPRALNGAEPEAIPVKDFDEYEFLKKFLGFD